MGSRSAHQNQSTKNKKRKRQNIASKITVTPKTRTPYIVKGKFSEACDNADLITSKNTYDDNQASEQFFGALVFAALWYFWHSGLGLMGNILVLLQ